MTSSSPMHAAAADGAGGGASKAASEDERKGLTEEQAEELMRQWGPNELPAVEVSLLWLFFLQFTGVMPYMLEVAAVISGACEDWADTGIIVAMLLANATLGFKEQLEAAAQLAELTKKMENKICILRDGVGEVRETRLLVPGDVVLLAGGVQVPADIEWLEGDVLSVDTAALTGEGIARKYPGQYGKLIYAGTTVVAGEAYGIVRNTGIRTETGSGQAEIMADKKNKKVSVFEQRILDVVKIVIGASVVDVIIIFIVQGAAYGQFSGAGIYINLLTCLSIIVAAIPIALPIVLQVTMALGAGKMAREFSAVVTSVPALQDISSMSVLCSDKTGTLTTARITIHADSVWCAPGFTKQDLALYGVLSSSRDKKEDPIDRAVVQHFDWMTTPASPSSSPVSGGGSAKLFGGRSPKEVVQEYEKVRSVGFNPIYKRVVYEYKHAKLGRVIIAKGLAIKVIDTADGAKDDAEDQWEVENVATLKSEVNAIDSDLSKRGYKTLGISIKVGDAKWKFAGILPMIDPPRHDTEATINNLKAAGIEVKMITGDHLNIAIETARQIGMGTNIHPGEATRDGSPKTKLMIKNADGFAQVLPKDKREVVEVLKKDFGYVVGMTGDGVNDAPALSAAQCGVAVHDATDAAKQAAAIILTSEGLSAIYSAVVESRRIFRKLKSYVTYRFAASIQIVVVLTVLIFASQCSIDSLYIILLALFNDITMLPIAYDFQQASSRPEDPNVTKILSVSFCLGLAETFFSLIFAYAAGPSGIFLADLNMATCAPPLQALPVQAGIWLQMFIAAELLIFSARAPGYMIYSILPSKELTGSVLAGCILISAVATGSSRFGPLAPADVLAIWVYDLLCLFLIDVIKVALFEYFQENVEVLPDEPPFKPPAEDEEEEEDAAAAAAGDVERGAGKRKSIGGIQLGFIVEDRKPTRGEAAGDRLTEFAIRNSIVDSDAGGDVVGDMEERVAARRRDSVGGGGRRSSGTESGLAGARNSTTRNSTTRNSLSLPAVLSSGADGLRGSFVLGGSLRPNNPANRFNS